MWYWIASTAFFAVFAAGVIVVVISIAVEVSAVIRRALRRRSGGRVPKGWMPQ